MKKGKCRLGVLVSGEGTNLQAILDASKDDSYPAEVTIVLSNVPGAGALKRAERGKIPTAIVSHKNFQSREEFEKALIEKLDRAGIDLVILAGFMRVLSPHFVRHYPNRILNIHPALLPLFPGTHAIERAWASGVKTTGVTVHFVDEGTDTGPVILQEEIPLETGMTLKGLEEKIHRTEHRLYPEAIRLYAEGLVKKILLAAAMLLGLMSPAAEARQGFAVGLGPIGNIYLIDTLPVLDPGVGGHFFFNYRFQDQIAFETSFFMTSQDGTSVSSTENGVLFLGMPTFDIKFYFLKEDPRFDPYIATGIGVYWLTEGSVGNSTGGMGLGAQLGLGTDYYVSDVISVGFEGVFRSIGLVTNLGTPSASGALFPYSLMGNVAFHF